MKFNDVSIDTHTPMDINLAHEPGIHVVKIFLKVDEFDYDAHYYPSKGDNLKKNSIKSKSKGFKQGIGEVLTPIGEPNNW